ncbi:MAG: hypothetical protein PSX71_13460 [bacterium]|nr:hypothetical protein [bacterium]
MIRWATAVAGLLMMTGVSIAAVEPLADTELGMVSGQEGIALQLDFYMNATPDSSRVAKPNDDSVPLSAAPFSNCTGLGNGCRLALQFNNRAPDWLVFKDFYMGARIYQINLDAGALSAASPSGTGYYDVSKFQSVSGACLLPGGVCSVAAINGLNALVLSYPGTTLTYNSTAAVVGGVPAFGSDGYTSMQLQMNIGRLLVETSTGDTTLNSYLGAKVGDNISKFAGMAIRGQAYVFGF